MGKTTTFKVSNAKAVQDSGESLHINMRRGIITANLNVYKFIDRDSKQVVVYVPSLEVSGYGDNDREAFEMLRFGLDDFGNHIVALPPDEMHQELVKFGWKKTMFNKDYSKAFVDVNGQLKGFNAEENTVERLTLQTA